MAYLELVLCVIIDGYIGPTVPPPLPLSKKIEIGLPTSSVEELASKSDQDWLNFFQHSPNWPKNNFLPPFSLPGTPDERVRAFIRHLRNFFDVSSSGRV